MAPLRPSDTARLVAEILRAYARVRRLMWRADLPAALRRLQGPPQPAAAPTDEDYALNIRLGRAVARTAQFIPADSRYLMRSLVLVTLMAAGRSSPAFQRLSSCRRPVRALLARLERFAPLSAPGRARLR
ncbi:MAG: hypothetical protein WKF96_22820 [Solirubrobacteraceae bacterium]